MAGPGVIQAELTVEMGQMLAALNQAQAAIARFAQGAGPAMKPANEALVTTYDKLRDIKTEAIQHQRVFQFYGAQLAELTGIARETGAALTGMVAGLASGMWVMAAIEGVKLAMSLFKGETDDTTKRLEEFKKKAHDAAIEIAQLNRDLLGLKRWSPEQVEIVPLQAARVNALSWKMQAAGETDPYEQRVLENRAKEDEATYARLGGAQREADLFKIIQAQGLINDQKADQAELDKNNADIQKRYNEELAEQQKNAQAYAAEEYRLQVELADAESAIWLEYFEKISKYPGLQVQEMAAALQKVAALKMKGAPEFGPGNKEGAAEFERTREANLPFDMFGPGNAAGEGAFEDNKQAMAVQVKLAHQLQSAWSTVGSAMAGAFNALGDAAGGAMGKVLKIIGQLVAGAVSLAIAMSAAAPPPWGAISMAAMAVGLIATIASTIAQVPSFEVGTSYVPRTGLAMIHQGEAIIPAGQNRVGGGDTYILNASFVDGKGLKAAFRANSREFRDFVREERRGGRG